MLCLQEQMARFHLRRKRLKIGTKQIPIILYIVFFFFSICQKTFYYNNKIDCDDCCKMTFYVIVYFFSLMYTKYILVSAIGSVPKSAVFCPITFCVLETAATMVMVLVRCDKSGKIRYLGYLWH